MKPCRILSNFFKKKNSTPQDHILYGDHYDEDTDDHSVAKPGAKSNPQPEPVLHENQKQVASAMVERPP